MEEKDPLILDALERLIDPSTRGDPQSPLRWTCKSTRQLAEALTQEGFPVNRSTVGELLRALGYSLQANSKTLEGKQHPDRDAQFQYISRQTKSFYVPAEPHYTGFKSHLCKLFSGLSAHRRTNFSVFPSDRFLGDQAR